MDAFNQPGDIEGFDAEVEVIVGSEPVSEVSRVPRSLVVGVDDLLYLPDMHRDRVYQLHERLGILTLHDLAEAAEARELRFQPGFDARAERKLRNGLRRLTDPALGLTLDWADHFAEGVSRQLEEQYCVSCVAVGALRRRFQTPLFPELLAITQRPDRLLERLAVDAEDGYLRGYRGRGSTGSFPFADLYTIGKQRVRVYACSPGEKGVALHLLTGSPAHLERLGWERFYREDFDGLSEEGVYRRAGLQYVPPELRNGDEEIDHARFGKLPRLIERTDRRGELHCHTAWSDGRDSIEAMVQGARARGLRYIAITDHSRSLHIAGGLTEREVLRQGEKIRSLRRKYPDIRVYWGLEVDILPDGSLDMPDAILSRLEFVLASAHVGLFASGREGLTKRLIAAARHPMVDCLGHPTGRILGIREPGPPDMEALLGACRETGTILEINASPDRLDLPDRWVRRARDLGIPLSVNTDAHAVADLDLYRYGVGCARRGWCGAKDVVNSMDGDRFDAWIRRPKSERWRLG